MSWLYATELLQMILFPTSYSFFNYLLSSCIVKINVINGSY